LNNATKGSLVNAKRAAVFGWQIRTQTGAVTGAGSAHVQGASAASRMTGTAYVTHGTGQWA
jgi:hypothetical protein